MRKARELRRLPLAELATAIGVSLQQLQKYETGENRITAARLHAIANAVGVPVSFFFSTAPDDGASAFDSSTVVLENLTPTKARFIRALMRIEDRALEHLQMVVYQVAQAGTVASDPPALGSENSIRRRAKRQST
ncbi:MAG: helix-turn-helix domain-containing protein [Phycisphaerae bacterium]